jgi:acyl dehydratase
MESTNIEIGARIPSVTKSVTTESILQFESCAILERENIHNNEELAKQRLGTTYTLASGRMSIAFASEAMRKFFGPDVFHHTGSVNLKFLRPVKNGDTVTVTGSVSSQRQVENGTEITVDLHCENQNHDRTAAGIGTAIV